jgi:hypothetical protein
VWTGHRRELPQTLYSPRWDRAPVSYRWSPWKWTRPSKIADFRDGFWCKPIHWLLAVTWYKNRTFYNGIFTSNFETVQCITRKYYLLGFCKYFAKIYCYRAVSVFSSTKLFKALCSLPHANHHHETLTSHKTVFWLELKTKFFQNGPPVALPVHKIETFVHSPLLFYYSSYRPRLSYTCSWTPYLKMIYDDI